LLLGKINQKQKAYPLIQFKVNKSWQIVCQECTCFFELYLIG
jgi:hypothetical protein